MKIRDDAHYEKGLAWLVGEAERLEDLEIHDKLMRDDRKAEMLVNYNAADQNLAIYRNAKAVKENPELASEYRKLGWLIEDPEPEPGPLPEPEPVIEQKSVNWLDD